MKKSWNLKNRRKWFTQILPVKSHGHNGPWHINLTKWASSIYGTHNSRYLYCIIFKLCFFSVRINYNSSTSLCSLNSIIKIRTRFTTINAYQYDTPVWGGEVCEEIFLSWKYFTPLFQLEMHSIFNFRVNYL